MRSVPTTTALLSRLQVFEPTKRPAKEGTRTHDTSWGRASVTGKLGQRHADVLELILYMSSKSEQGSDGRILLLVDEYKIRKGLGRGYESSGSQLTQWLRELMHAQLELFPKGWDEPVAGKLVESVKRSSETVPSPGRYTSAQAKTGERHLKVVELGQVMSSLIAKDIPLFYNPLRVVDCRSGVAQALVRHVKTHKKPPPGGWKLDELLLKIGVDQIAAFPNRRRELKKSEGYLRGLGISIEDSRVLLSEKPAA